MPRSARSRTWFFPTSPRSPYKVKGELALLKSFEGREWNVRTQAEFARLLRGYEPFEGDSSSDEPAFSGRDRVRVPRLLGLVYFPKKKRGGTLAFTDAGNALLTGPDESSEYLYQRQIAKVQFGSPLHEKLGFEDMRIRPLTAMIALVLNVGGMSKEEIALFGLTLTDFGRLASRGDEIREYRAKLAQFAPGRAKLDFARKFRKEWIRSVYAQDIEDGNTNVREGGAGTEALIRKKGGLLRDYADSTARFLQATGLFTLAGDGRRLTVSERGRADAEYLLAHVGLAPLDVSGWSYDRYVREYLGNPSIPAIRMDSLEEQSREMGRLVDRLGTFASGAARELEQSFQLCSSSVQRLGIIGQASRVVGMRAVELEASHVRSDVEESLGDVLGVYNEIAQQECAVVDRPLRYEWNSWRAMLLLDVGAQITPNFGMDPEGNPISLAPDRLPDMVGAFDGFWLLMEARWRCGARQCGTVGSSVVRQFMEFRAQRISQGDQREVLGLLVAEKVPEALVTYLRDKALGSRRGGQGPIWILPLDRASFTSVASYAAKGRFSAAKGVKNLITFAFSPGVSSLPNEQWSEAVAREVESLSAGVGPSWL